MNRFLKHALALWSVCLLSGSVPALGACLTPPGDLDGSGVSNVVDVQCDILLVLWELSADEMAPAPSCLHVSVSEADVNCDGANNVTDVLLLIQYALNVPIDSSIDIDGDGCLDSCALLPAQGEIQLDSLDTTTINACAPITVWLEEDGEPASYTDAVILSGDDLIFFEDASCSTLLSAPLMVGATPVTLGARPQVAGQIQMNATGPASTPNSATLNVWNDSFADDTRGLETLVVYNENFPGGDTIAEYYAAARGVPEAQVCPVLVSTGTYGSAEELISTRQQIVENCLCPLTDISPCGVAQVESIQQALALTYLVLIKGIPNRLTGTAWPGDNEEPTFGHYLSILLTRVLDGVFEDPQGVALAKIYYPNADQEFSYSSAYSPTLKLVPEDHGYMAYAKMEAITVDRTLDLIDRSLAGEAIGFTGNGIVEGPGSGSFELPPNPTNYPLYYALSAFDPVCSDYLSYTPFVAGAPESTWPHEQCRWGSTQCSVDGCVKGYAPGNMPSTIPTPIDGGFFIGLNPLANLTPTNNQAAFNKFSALRKWHVGEENCVELCTDLSTAEAIAECQANSLDYFKEFNSDCVGVAPGFMGSQLRSFTVQSYGFLPSEWFGGGGGALENTPPTVESQGGFQNDLFTDSNYLHYGTYTHDELDTSTCLIDGGSVPCPERIAIFLQRNIYLAAPLPVEGERSFNLLVRYRNQGSPQAKLQMRLMYWGELATENNGTLAKQESGLTPMLTFDDTHGTWQEAEFTVVIPEADETLITKFRLVFMGLFGQKIRGFVDLDGIEVIDIASGEGLVPLSVGSFDLENHHKVHSGGFATDVIDRLGGTAWWGSSSHFQDMGYAYGSSGVFFSRLMMGRTLGESVAGNNGRSGLVFGDPLYRSTAVKISSGKEDGYMAYSDSAPGLEMWSDFGPELTTLFLRVLRGTDNLETVRWEFSRCTAESPLDCSEATWTSLETGVGAIRDYEVSAFDVVPSVSEDWVGILRLRQWLPGAAEDHLSAYGKITYNAFPKPAPLPCPWDLNEDGWVSSADSQLILLSLDCSEESLLLFDLDSDQDVDENDLAILVEYFGAGATPEEAGCCDYNGDGLIWIEDVDAIMDGYCGQPIPKNGDLNQDDAIDDLDSDLILGNLGPCP